MRQHAVSRLVRVFVYLFLAAFIACGLFAVEAYPLTGWRLFSQARARHQQSWAVMRVDAARQEHPMPFGEMGVAYRGWVHVLNGFARLSVEEQRAVCEAWAEGARAVDAEVRTIRIYRVHRDIGDRAHQGERTLRYSCPEPTGS